MAMSTLRNPEAKWELTADEYALYKQMNEAEKSNRIDIIGQNGNNGEHYEQDPTGRDAHDPGAKLDAGKPRCGLVLGAFARALTEVSKVGTYGAAKYSDAGWLQVPDGKERYEDAMLRHYLAKRKGEVYDGDSGLRHDSHLAWNALAILELTLKEIEDGTRS